MLAACIGTVALALAVVRSESGGRHLCTLAAATLRDATGQPVEVGHCKVDPLAGRLHIEHVRMGPPESPLLSAERLALAVSLRNRLRIDAVEVIRPRIALDLSSPGGAGEEPPGPGKPQRSRAPNANCLPDMSLLELGRITLVDGSIEARLPDGHTLTSDEITVGLREVRRRLEFSVSVGRSQLQGPTAALDVDRGILEGELDPESGTARLHGLDIGAHEGSVFGQAEITSLCGIRGTASVTVRADLEWVGTSLLRKVPGLGGSLEARAVARFDLFNVASPFELNADVTLKDGRVLDMRPGDFTAAVTLRKDGLEVRRFELPLDSGTVKGTATLGLRSPFDLAASADLTDFSLGELLVKLGVNRLPVHVVASGLATAKGPLAGPDGMQLDSTLDVRVRDMGVYDDTWQKRDTADRYVGLAAGHLKARGVVGTRNVRLRSVSLESPGSSITVSGNVEYRHGLDLQVRSEKVSLDELGPFSSGNIGGVGSVTGTVRGPYRTLDIRAAATVTNGRVSRLDLGEATADVHLDLDAGYLHVTNASGRRGDAAWKGNARLKLYGGVRMEESVARFSKSSLGDLVLSARNYAPSLEKLTKDVSATFDGEVRASGPVRRLNAFAELDLSDVVAYGQPFRGGVLALSLTDLDRIDVHELRLNLGDTEVRGTGRLSIDTLRHDAEIEVSNLHVHDLARLAEAESLDGRVGLRLVSEGRITSPRARGELVLEDWFYGERPLWTARLGVRVLRGVAELDGSVVSPWPRGKPRPQVEPGAPAPIPMGAMVHTVSGTVRLQGNLPFGLDLDLNVPDATALFAPGELGDMEAGLGGRVHARGEALNPLGTEAILELDRLWGRKGRWSVRNTGTVMAVLERGRISLQALPIGGPGFQVDAFGVREPNGELDFTVRGRAELDVLRDVVGGLEEAQGRLDLDVAVSGTVDDPSLVGYARLEDARLRPSGALVTLENAHGLVTFSPEALVIDGLEGQLNGGPVEVSGSVEMDNFMPRRLDLRVLLGEVPLRLEGIPLVVAGSPTISGTPDQLLLGGELEVVRFRFQRDIELERVLVQTIELARRPPAPQVFERSGEFLTLDLGIRLGDVRVDNNLLQTDLRGDLRLTGTNKRPGLLGTVTLVGGRAFMRNTEFEVTSGVLNFTDRTRIRPTFDLRAEAQVRDYALSVSASGSPQQPRILLSSEPPLPEADIVTLLTLGITSRDFDDPRVDTSSVGGFLVDAAYNASGLNRQVQSLLPQTDILRDATFRLTSAYSEVSGNIEPIAQFETKFLTDDLKLRAQTSLLGNRGRRAQAEYRLDERISAQVQWDSDNPSAPSIGDIGGDLKLHWEIP